MKNNFFLLFLVLFSFSALGQSWKNASYEADLPVYDNEKFLGDAKVKIQNEKLIWIERDSLINALSRHISEDTLAALKKLNPLIDPTTLPLPLHFNPQDLKLEMPLALETRSRESLNLLENYHHQYEAEALKPAPFGGAINYRLEQMWSSPQDQGKTFSGQFDSFLNFHSLVFENQSYYQSTPTGTHWFRGDTRLVKDFEKQLIRVQAGDVYPQIQGFMTSRPLGGINISRNFSLNPYRLAYPTGTQNFTLRARSQVKYFVNGVLVKSEYLPAGNYTASDIPLTNGLNTVQIEATDDLGQKLYFVFRTAASINLLNKGESRFDVSYGVPFTDNNFQRDYMGENGELLSGFYQYGFSSIFSASGYAQKQLEYQLVGSEIIQATPIGNFIGGYARSSRDKLNGEAASLSYQLQSQGVEWYKSQALGLRYEYRNNEFVSSLLDLASVVKNNYSATYTLPIAHTLTVSLGGNYGDVRDNKLSNRYGFDTTLNLRLFEHHNLSFFVGRNRTEYKQWNDVAYAFLTITIPEKNDFVSALYDQQQKSTRVTYIKDNQNRLFEPRLQGTVENNGTQQAGEVDVLVPTPYADMGGRVRSAHLIDEDQVLTRSSVRMNSSFVFAYDKGRWGGGISRPVPNSFVIFKPEPRLKGQKIALKSTSPFTEAQTGLFDEITFTNLLAYQYRDIQLDPSMMEVGRSLRKEKFILYPTYRSAHLIGLEERGAVILSGTMLNADGKPFALQVGKVSDKTFFTNRDGEFFIEGVEAGNYMMTIDGQEQQFPIKIDKNERGFKPLGTFIIERAE